MEKEKDKYSLLQIDSSSRTVNKRFDTTLITCAHNAKVIKSSNNVIELLRFMALELVEDSIAYDMNVTMDGSGDIHFETLNDENFILKNNYTGMYYSIHQKYDENDYNITEEETIEAHDITYEEHEEQQRKTAKEVIENDYIITLIGNENEFNKMFQFGKWIM